MYTSRSLLLLPESSVSLGFLRVSNVVQSRIRRPGLRLGIL